MSESFLFICFRMLAEMFKPWNFDDDAAADVVVVSIDSSMSNV